MADNEKQDSFFAPPENQLYSENSEIFGSKEKRLEYYNRTMQQGNSPGYDNAVTNSFRGFNPFNPGPAMLEVGDNVIGLNFVTKPEINLNDANVLRSEKLISLYGSTDGDANGFIRATLDRRWGIENFGEGGHPMVDNLNPFIGCLNEYLKTSTGFSDLQMRVNTTEPGLRQQVYQYIAGKLEENGQFPINQTYYDTRPGLISTLFQHWETYASESKSGDSDLTPHLDYLFGERIDSDCRIYSLVLNRDTEYLESIFCAIRGWPTTFPAGSIADIDRTKGTRRGDGQDDISINFSMEAMRFNEISLVNAFNEHTYYFNPALYMTVVGRSKAYRMLDISEYTTYRYMMYPLLIPFTTEVKRNDINGRQNVKSGIKLTWWVRSDL